MSASPSEQLKSSVRPSPHPPPKNVFACEWENCGKVFKQQSDLKNHIRTHTGEKPYVCCHEECRKKFATNSQLRRHERSHSTNKPCVCIVAGCGKAFRTVGHLKRHQKAHFGDGTLGTGPQQLASLYVQSLGMVTPNPSSFSAVAPNGSPQHSFGQQFAETKLPPVAHLTALQPLPLPMMRPGAFSFVQPANVAPAPEQAAAMMSGSMLPRFYYERQGRAPISQPVMQQQPSMITSTTVFPTPQIVPQYQMQYHPLQQQVLEMHQQQQLKQLQYHQLSADFTRLQ